MFVKDLQAWVFVRYYLTIAHNLKVIRILEAKNVSLTNPIFGVFCQTIIMPINFP